jgi:uncharacterized repeat protein (TIGR01451 family)
MNKVTRNFAYLLMWGTAVAAFQIGAQSQTDSLESKLEMRKVVQLNGKETLQNAATVAPGEVIEYQATYTNKSISGIRSFVVTLPIPGGMELLPGSIKPQGAKASVDGSEFQPIPLKRKERGADGKELEQEIPFHEYRYLRWFPDRLEGKQSATFSARAKVSDDRTSNLPGPAPGKGP